jgi:hypothetical protein
MTVVACNIRMQYTASDVNTYSLIALRPKLNEHEHINDKFKFFTFFFIN